MKLEIASIPLDCVQLDDQKIAESIKESRWQKGLIVLNGHKLEGERRITFDEVEYRIGNQFLNKVDSFLPTEFFEWRDG